MLFSPLDKSSKYTANTCGLTTPPCLTSLDTRYGSDQCLPHFICIVFPCANVSLGAQSTLIPFYELVSQIISCVVLDRMLLRHQKQSMHRWAMGYKVWRSLLQQNTMSSLKTNWLLSVVPRRGEMQDNMKCSSSTINRSFNKTLLVFVDIFRGNAHHT